MAEDHDYNKEDNKYRHNDEGEVDYSFGQAVTKISEDGHLNDEAKGGNESEIARGNGCQSCSKADEVVGKDGNDPSDKDGPFFFLFKVMVEMDHFSFFKEFDC